MPNRIAIILPDLRMGGGQRVLLGLTRQFIAYGQSVDIVALFDDGEFVRELPVEEGRYCKLLPKRGSASVWRSTKALLALVHYLRQTRPDVVLSSMTGTNLLTAAACKLARVNTRLLLREAASFANLRGSFFLLLMRVLYRRANALIAVSKGVANDLASVGLDQSRIHVVNNPVDADRLRDMAREAMSTMESDVPYIVSIGRLVVQKDHESLLRAYAISQARHRYKLVIVGDGELRNHLGGLSKELGIDHRVVWMGALPNPYGVLSKASLLVLSSRWEGYPNVLLEAAALGVPVVSTDCPAGPREMLNDGVFGRLASVGDHQGLARAMDQELEEPSVGRDDLIHAHQTEVIARRYLFLMGIRDAVPM